MVDKRPIAHAYEYPQRWWGRSATTTSTNWWKRRLQNRSIAAASRTNYEGYRLGSSKPHTTTHSLLTTRLHTVCDRSRRTRHFSLALQSRPTSRRQDLSALKNQAVQDIQECTPDANHLPRILKLRSSYSSSNSQYTTAVPQASECWCTRSRSSLFRCL